VKKRIGLGTWSWGNKLFWNYQSTNDDDLRETYNEALRRGFDLIDTADSYGTGNLQGRSELLLGKFLIKTPSSKKKRIQVATKLAPYPWRIGNRGFNKPFLKSLERLNKKLDIVNYASRNSELALKNHIAQSHSDKENLSQLSKVLNMTKKIKRVEAYDNSHLSGKNAVGAMIVYSEEGFEKKSYRKNKYTNVRF